MKIWHVWHVAKPCISLMRLFQSHFCVLVSCHIHKAFICFVWTGICCSKFLTICCKADFLRSIWNGSDFFLPLCMAINSTWMPGGCFRDWRMWMKLKSLYTRAYHKNWRKRVIMVLRAMRKNEWDRTNKRRYFLRANDISLCESFRKTRIMLCVIKIFIPPIQKWKVYPWQMNLICFCSNFLFASIKIQCNNFEKKCRFICLTVIALDIWVLCFSSANKGPISLSGEIRLFM